MSRSFLVATYSDADSLVRSVRALRREKFRIYDVYAPYPIHNIEQEMAIRHSRLPWVALIGSVSGLFFALGLQFYTVLDWPLNVGGKPANSTLAFIPIMFELMVLFGGLPMVVGLLLRTRLYPGKTEQLPHKGVTNDRFALVLRHCDTSFDVSRARALLMSMGAETIHERTGGL
jgi:Protein of unknown function (DUF3341)